MGCDWSLGGLSTSLNGRNSLQPIAISQSSLAHQVIAYSFVIQLYYCMYYHYVKYKHEKLF